MLLQFALSKFKITHCQSHSEVFRGALELLKETGYLSVEEFTGIHADATEIIKLLTSIIKTTKANMK